MKLNKQEHKHIRKALPQLNLILNRGENEAQYNKIIVSVFDRFMTREEFEIYDDIDFETLRERRNKFENSVTKLYYQTNCYVWRYKRKSKPFVYKPKNLDSLLKKFNIKNQTYKTGEHYELILPEYQAIYSREFDWTNIIWYLDESKLPDILKIVKESGLHIIN